MPTITHSDRCLGVFHCSSAISGGGQLNRVHLNITRCTSPLVRAINTSVAYLKLINLSVPILIFDYFSFIVLSVNIKSEVERYVSCQSNNVILA